MLYPVAPDKLEKFVERLNAASDEANLPRPNVARAPDREKAYDEVDGYLERFGEPDELVGGFDAITFRGRTYLVVDVTWPSPLRTLDSDETVIYRDVPCGPSRLAMWAALQYLPDPAEQRA